MTSPRVILKPAGYPPVTVDVEVAKTPNERQVGLMFRRQLDEFKGMIFVFTEPEQQAFWMHNTLIPLDMVFITDRMTVLGVVENATPRTDDPRQVDGLSQYVLEVQGGFAQKHHIGAGTVIEFQNIPPATQ